MPDTWEPSPLNPPFQENPGMFLLLNFLENGCDVALRYGRMVVKKYSDGPMLKGAGIKLSDIIS